MWRLLIGKDVDHSQALAEDDAMAQSAASVDQVTLRLYTYRSCVLVGRFQHVTDEVQVDSCREMGIPINRRPTGGGSIVMGPDQLGVALIIPSQNSDFEFSSERLMRQCATGIVSALEMLGIQARFHGKNDLVVAGRKIAGLGLYRSHAGGRLFHASVLLDLDIGYMLRVLRTPFEKMRDKGFKPVSERICTVHGESRNSMTMREFVNLVAAGYTKAFDVQLRRGNLESTETELSDRLCREQYATEEWVNRDDLKVRDRVGRYQMRTDGGSLDVRTIVAGQMVKSVFVNGDFVASDNAVADLESSLKWHVRDAGALSQTISKVVERNAGGWPNISATDVANAVLAAIEDTAIESSDRTPNPCFAREENANV